MSLRFCLFLPVMVLTACQPYPAAVADGIELIDPASVDIARMTPTSTLSPKPYKVRRSPVAAASTRPMTYRSPVMAASPMARGPAMAQQPRPLKTPAPRALAVGPPAVAPQRAASRPDTNVYRSQSEVKDLHRVIGEVRVATDGRESPQSIRSSFERQARSRNAQGVIIQDPADRPYGNSEGPGFDQPREITVIFIRYDDPRSGGSRTAAPVVQTRAAAYRQQPDFSLPD